MLNLGTEIIHVGKKGAKNCLGRKNREKNTMQVFESHPFFLSDLESRERGDVLCRQV